MKLLDRFFPVRPWIVTANGVHLGIYHARTAWGAKRFVGFYAKPAEETFVAPVPVEGKGIHGNPIFSLENTARLFEEALAKRPFVEDYSLAKKYGGEIAEGLQWNIENADSYREGVWAVVEVEYEKTSKGKTKKDRHTFGVVNKYEAETFITELAARWAVFVDGLSQQGKPLPPVNNLNFSYFTAYIGWRKFKKEVDNYDIEDRYGRTKIDHAFKQLKSL